MRNETRNATQTKGGDMRHGTIYPDSIGYKKWATKAVSRYARIHNMSAAAVRAISTARREAYEEYESINPCPKF